MTVSFPPSPSNGDTYLYNGTVFVFDGVKWVSGGATAYASSAQGELAETAVQRAGDNMTGDLTLGTDKITLDATGGDITMLGSQLKCGSYGSRTTVGVGANVFAGSKAATVFIKGEDASATAEALVVQNGSDPDNDVVVSLKYDGSAEFAGNVISSVDPTGGGATGIALRGSIGRIQAAAEASQLIYQGYTVGSSASTFQVFGNGSAEFAAAVQIGNDPRDGTNAGTRLGTTTGLTATGDIGAQYVVSLYNQGVTGRTVGIQASGSATFAGNVGIANTSPTANLEIGTAGGNNSTIKLNSSTVDYLELSSEASTGYIIAGHPTTGNAELGFKTSNGAGPAERMRLDGAGRLALSADSATNQPGHFEMQGGGNSVTSGTEFCKISFLTQDVNVAGSDKECARIAAIAENDHGSNSDAKTGIGFFTRLDEGDDPNERMRVNNAGQVLVNTTTVLNNSAMLQVAGPVAYGTPTGSADIIMATGAASYTASTSSTPLFDIVLATGHGFVELTYGFTDISSPNGARIGKMYLSYRGSGNNISAVNIVAEDKIGIASGSLTTLAWSAAVQSTSVIRLSVTGSNTSGDGTIYLYGTSPFFTTTEPIRAV